MSNNRQKTSFRVLDMQQTQLDFFSYIGSLTALLLPIQTRFEWVVSKYKFCFKFSKLKAHNEQ